MKNSVWNAEEMASIANKDRLLPSQPYFSKMYTGDDYYGDLEKFILQVQKPTVLDIKTKDGLSYSCMGSDYNTLHFFQFLIRSHGYKKVLELGTYIGVSAMYMAMAGAEVVSTEVGSEFYNIAKENIKVNGFADKIHLCNLDVLRFLENDDGKYDLIFIDCAKESYKEILELSLRRLADNGMILVDDVFFQGDTLNKVPTSKKGHGVREMLDYVATLEGYDKVMLPLGNGLLMLRKKS